AADPVQPRRADAAVELLRVEFDVVEVVLERLLADEVVDGGDRLRGLCRQRLVSQREQARGLLAAKRLAQRVPGKAHHAVGTGQSVDAGIDRAARLEI